MLEKLNVNNYNIKEVNDAKQEFLNLVGLYDTEALKVSNQSFIEYVNKDKMILANQKRFLSEFITNNVEPMLYNYAKKSTFYEQKLKLKRYPLSLDTDKEKRLLGEMQINSAILSLNTLQSNEDLFPLLDVALDLGRTDYFNALIDNFLAKYKTHLMITNSLILVKDTTGNVIEDQKFYEKLNDYRIGLKQKDVSLTENIVANEEMMFLFNQVVIMRNILADCISHQTFMPKYLTGYDIQKALIPDSYFSDGTFNRILSFYPNNGQELLKGQQ